jgi:hypothetical protein
VFGEFGFEVGDALVEESVVLACGLEAFLKPLVVLRSLAQPVFQGGVLGDESLDGVFGEVEFKVSDLAEELPDAGPLGSDLGAGGFEGVLGVECPFFPGAGGLDCPAFLILGLQCWRLLGGCGEEGAGCGVLVEERAGDVGAASDGCGGDVCPFAVQSGSAPTPAAHLPRLITARDQLRDALLPPGRSTETPRLCRRRNGSR